MNKTKPVIRVLLIVLLVVVLIMSGLWLFYPPQQNAPASSGPTYNEVQVLAQQLNFPQISEDHEIGTTESIVNDDAANAESIHYPVLGIDSIDQKIKQKVDDIKAEFERQKAEFAAKDPNLQSELLVEYSSYVMGEHTASVVLSYDYNFSSLAHPDAQVDTLVFDLKEEKQLTLDDVFQGDYRPVLSKLAVQQFEQSDLYKEAIQEEQFQAAINDPKAFQKFALKDGNLLLYFDKYQLFAGSYGIPMITIPFSDLDGFLKINTEGKLAPTITEPAQTDTPPEPSQPVQAPAIDPSKPMIALSFDDGPHPVNTPRILDTLKQNGARATFFVLGNRVDSYADVLKREYEEGHEIGSHTFSHASLNKLGTEDLNYQVNETDSRIQNLIGVAPALLRPPYGAVNDTVKAMVNKPLALWNLDTLDWKSRDKDAVANTILRDVSDGDIILMHDLYGSTADAVEIAVPELVKRGYQIVTVSELLNARSITPTAGKVYTDAMP
ncbi:MAG: polysaccharide deacetylase family protein [Massilioclostridium sp.]|nr:polysaccharide deacetylase family protein [Massilioclostridium sp.]MEE1492017.1 polysaccharide deacetylase family protein [Massilioclostridium sp.]